MSDSFFEEGSRLLTPNAFEFVLDGELKRAVRSQNFLTLVVLEAKREWEGLMVTADDGTVEEVAQLVAREIRDTDLIGHTEKGTLSVVLLDADFDSTARVRVCAGGSASRIRLGGRHGVSFLKSDRPTPRLEQKVAGSFRTA